MRRCALQLASYPTHCAVRRRFDAWSHENLVRARRASAPLIAAAHPLRTAPRPSVLRACQRVAQVLAPLRCPLVRYWLVTRDPVERILARLSKTKCGASSGANSTRDFVSLDAAVRSLQQTVVLPPSRRGREFSGSSALDNALVRGLLGPPVYTLSLGALGAQHLRRAKAAASSFEVVIPLANLSWLPALVSVAHDTCVRAPVPHSVSGSCGADRRALAAASARLLPQLRAHNQLDSELVRWSAGRFERELETALATLRARPRPCRAGEAPESTAGARVRPASGARPERATQAATSAWPGGVGGKRPLAGRRLSPSSPLSHACGYSDPRKTVEAAACIIKLAHGGNGARMSPSDVRSFASEPPVFFVKFHKVAGSTVAGMLASRCLSLMTATNPADGAAAEHCSRAGLRLSHELTQRMYVEYGRCAAAKRPRSCREGEEEVPRLFAMMRDPISKWLSNVFYWSGSASRHAGARDARVQRLLRSAVGTWTASDVRHLEVPALTPAAAPACHSWRPLTAPAIARARAAPAHRSSRRACGCRTAAHARPHCRRCRRGSSLGRQSTRRCSGEGAASTRRSKACAATSTLATTPT